MPLLLDKFQLTNKVAIITGGVGLLGIKHAEAIAEMGGKPILLDIDDEKGEVSATQISKKYNINCYYFNCDITNEDAIGKVKDEIIKSHGKIDILINNAAIDPKVKADHSHETSRLEKFSLEQWNLELSVGLTGAYLCSKIFGGAMAQNGEGVVVNVSSDLGLISPNQNLYRKEGLKENQQPVKPITYSVIKHGIIGMTKYLATYWADKGIRVNAISPGGIYTNQPDEFVSKISELIPLGRMAHEDEYKAAIVFLCSDASSYMTGSNLVIDGGRTIL
jgi:NAD(P)-dependent dehydrogenase (short-subunit alcohol dehydrogenase family)